VSQLPTACSQQPHRKNFPDAPLFFDIPFIYKDDAPLVLLPICPIYPLIP